MIDAQILEAVDRLNSWVRSDSARSVFGSPRYAIYDWKLAVIEKAIRSGECQYRAIHLMMRCRACGGTGKYTDWNGISYPDCRKCSSSKMVRLSFLESAIGDYKWHTPRDKTWKLPVPRDIWDKAALSVDWEPNAKGKDLQMWEVAKYLNVLEEATRHGQLPSPSSHEVYNGNDWYGEIQHGYYHLVLDYRSKRCELCKRESTADNDGCFHHVTRGNIEWSAWACNVCRAAYPAHSTEIFADFPLPLEELAHPEIQKWLARSGWRRMLEKIT